MTHSTFNTDISITEARFILEEMLTGSYVEDYKVLDFTETENHSETDALMLSFFNECSAIQDAHLPATRTRELQAA